MSWFWPLIFMSLLDDKCVHGWIMPPECPACLTTERDKLSEDLRRNLETIRFLRHRIDRLHEILDDVYGIIISHHSDEYMKGDICPVCLAPENGQIMTALEQNRKQLNQKRKESAGKHTHE